MLLSHKNAWVFIHVPRTGGTSLRQVLSPHAEFEHHNDAWQHASAAWIRHRHVGDKWPTYFSFGVIRNPWDLTWSDYHYRRQIAATLAPNVAQREWFAECQQAAEWTFAEFVRWYCGRGNRGMAQLYLQDVSYVARFEDLAGGARHILGRLGIPDTPLPHVNASDHGPYRCCYDRRSKDLVARKFADDIRRFDYEF